MPRRPRHRKPNCRARSYRPRLEALEPRCLPALVQFGGDILKETFDDLRPSDLSDIARQFDDPGRLPQIDPVTGNVTYQPVGPVFHHEFDCAGNYLFPGGTTAPLTGQQAQLLFCNGDTITIEPYYPPGSVPGSADVNQVALDVCRNSPAVSVTFFGANGQETFTGPALSSNAPSGQVGASGRNSPAPGSNSGPGTIGAVGRGNASTSHPGDVDTFVATEQDIIGQDAAGHPILLGSIQRLRIRGYEQQIDNLRALVFFPNIHVPPTIGDVTYTFPHGSTSPLSIGASNGLLLQGQSPNGLPITAKLVHGPGFDPSHGTITAFNAQTGTFTYTPNPAGSRLLPDSFAFQLNDGMFDSPVAFVHLRPDHNNPPVVTGLVLENRPHAEIGMPVDIGRLLRLAWDPDGDPVQIAHIDGPSHGTLVDNNGVYTYNPNPDTIEDSFSVTFTDGYDTSTGLVTLSCIDHAPTAKDWSFDVNMVHSVTEPRYSTSGEFFNPTDISTSTSAVSMFSVTDQHGRQMIADADAGDVARLHVVIVSQPRNGQLDLDPTTGVFTYVPSGPKFYTDHFSYYVTDDYQNSNVATVTLVPRLWLVPRSDAYSTRLVNRSQVGLLANDSFPQGANVLDYVQSVILTTDLSVRFDYHHNNVNMQEIGGIYGSDITTPVPVGGVISTDGTFTMFFRSTTLDHPSSTNPIAPSDYVDSFAYKVHYAQNDDDVYSSIVDTDPIGVLVHVTNHDESSVTGVGDAVERSNPAGLDTNGDGVEDWLQDNVATLPIVDGPHEGQYMTVVAPDNVKLVGVQSLSGLPGPLPLGADWPFGFLAFDVAGLPAHGEVAVTLILPGDVPQGFVDYKYFNAVSGWAGYGWHAFPYDPATNRGAKTHWDDPSIPTNEVVLILQDQEFGDQYEIPTDIAKFQQFNGIIVDPGGLLIRR